MRSQEEKQESSIPVATRVDLTTLAELAIWWERSGYRVKTMSQLVSWSLDLLKNTLRSNQQISESELTATDANRWLTERGLYQQSVRSRAAKKIATALRFESMREEGVDPRQYVPQQYNVVHNKQSVQPLDGKEVKVPVKNNFSEIKFVQLDEYPGEYVYPEGDEATKERLINQLRSKGIKSFKEMKEEEMERVNKSNIIVKSE